MIAILDGQLDESRGLVTYEVLEPIELESIVSHHSKTFDISQFSTGAKIQGYPARLRIIQIDSSSGSKVDMGVNEGVLVEKGDGHFLFPFQYVKEVYDLDLVKEVEDVDTDEIKEQLKDGASKIKNVLTKPALLGFTWGQIVLIAGVTLVVTKIAGK